MAMRQAEKSKICYGVEITSGLGGHLIFEYLKFNLE